jgi:nucleoside-diphosphate-sugar epimerase
MNTIAIIGASGYIGRHLVARLALQCGNRVRVLTRNQASIPMPIIWPSNVEIIKGNLFDKKSLLELLEPGCILINLAYLWQSDELENLAVIRNLLEACEIAQVKRLIHCSTAAVVGRISDNNINEETPCRPLTKYGIIKLKIEQEIIRVSNGTLETAILRPTGVFGAGGEPLIKLSNDLLARSRLRNYLKSCLFGRRRMNLVHIENVVAAIQFLIQRYERIEGEIFIVSDDKTAINNFLDIEQFLMRKLDCPRYPYPRIPLPLGVLSLLLRIMGRNNINPRCNYEQGKLESIGFKSPMAFEEGLSAYADWYRSTFFAVDTGRVK